MSKGQVYPDFICSAGITSPERNSPYATGHDLQPLALDFSGIHVNNDDSHEQAPTQDAGIHRDDSGTIPEADTTNFVARTVTD